MADDTTEGAAFDPTAFSDAELSAELARVAERGRELAAKATSEFAAGEGEELTELAEHLPLLQAETQRRIEAANAQQAQRDAFANLGELPTIPAVTPAAPLAPPVSSSEPAPAPQVPSVSQMGAQAPVLVPADKTERKGWTGRLVPHTSGLLQRGVGQEFSGITEISETLLRSAQSVAGADGRYGIAQFDRSRGAELTISEREHGNEVMRKIRQARSEYSLPGGSLAKAWQQGIEKGNSLTAAAGWCAPSQNDYDLCMNWSAGVGLLDLPTVTAPRGGINYTDEPTFPEIYANAVAAGGGSNLLTEAEVIADTVKTCSVIPCPTFEDRRLDVAALCIRASFLQQAGYPEVVNAWIDGLLAAHEQEINRNIIAQILTRAGAATVFASPDPDGDSFTSAVLAAVELARKDLQYRFMLSPNSTIEVIMPMWVEAQIRADLSRRSGDTGNLLNVSDAQIASMFSLRGARVQFVRGWQDGLITGGALNPAFPGGDAATPFMTALPSTFSFLAWPAGSVVLARQDVITLTNVYDSTLLGTNQFTALFTEEGYAPLFPCPGQRLYTVSGCIGGITGAHTIDCTDAP